ncbi:condensation domain-containing protein, partial [Paenibacillus elgii]
TEIEEKLAELWSEVLGADRIGVHDSFFERGGHSLKVTRLVTLIHKELSVKLSYRDIFEKPTIRSLAVHIGEVEQERFVSIPPAPPAAYYPLSYAQNRMFIQQQIYPDSTSYNISLVYLVQGRLDKPKIAETFNRLAQRHESLRTCFTLVQNSPVQRILDRVELGFEEYSCPEEQLEPVIHRLIRPFNLERAPLLRAGLVQVGSDRHVLVLDMHHIVADGMSVDLIAADFFAMYAGDELPKLPIHYKDYAVWEQSRERKELAKKQETYWLDVFFRPVQPLELPIDYPRDFGVQDSEAAIASFVLDADWTAKVRDLAFRHQVSLYVLLLAVYNVLLAKCCGQEDIVVGTVTSGRNHDDLKQVVGMFANTIPQRNFPAKHKTFFQFLQEVHDNALQGFQHQEYPLEKLVNRLNLKRDLNRNPLFDTFFQIQYFEERQQEIGELLFTPYPYRKNNTSQFELELSVEEEQERLQFHLHYSSQLYKRETIESLWDAYYEALQKVIGDEHIQLGDMRLSVEPRPSEDMIKLSESIQFNF